MCLSDWPLPEEFPPPPVQEALKVISIPHKTCSSQRHFEGMLFPAHNSGILLRFPKETFIQKGFCQCLTCHLKTAAVPGDKPIAHRMFVCPISCLRGSWSLFTAMCKFATPNQQESD